MNKRYTLMLAIFVYLSCAKPSPDQSEIKILKDAYRSGHLAVVMSILKEIQDKRSFVGEEEVLFAKTLFYQGNWKEFFSFWDSVQNKTPEIVLLYFKAVLISKEPVPVSTNDEFKLVELLPVSPEACLLYLKFTKDKNKIHEKKLFLAQSKQFQTHLDRLHLELGEKR
ncbi:hypothetical protein ND861_14790 [Leptospira sp. 2 VSF19]|uniref:Lipoprotein n=1 Tax=Leptospira soteropolitanensis TaxID=2950025 RepID=A0AAW5VP91_9LEPT|nr:hypothetical protein [Leptospira soteropolitanensis]MCW7493885.1 hypothetical protein [Leptospira soteropolitanensis]MCW7501479.1 hypothetical protein [Leptospira soteropolitanensis]MCW7523758.1 hypothetical protein [Leptospira soteropolitanensis]MCW7527622.1 hypothetical protein [Leptospira soteropolitanensis]MCW7531476.1 hypothetical protein [Leptospira soteropolitanensis]